MAQKQIVLVETGMVSIWQFAPHEAYEVEKLPDGTLVFTPVTDPSAIEAAVAAAELDDLDEYPGGVTIRPIYADEWRDRGLS